MRIRWWWSRGRDGSEENEPKFEFEISSWVFVGSLFAYLLWMALETGFSAASVNRLVTAALVLCVVEIGPRFVSLAKGMRNGRTSSRAASAKRVPRSDKLLRMSSLLLSRADRERYLEEWLDDLESRRERGEHVWRVAVWIVLRSVLPLSLRSVGSKTLGRITRR
jgi:hypothetical protein